MNEELLKFIEFCLVDGVISDKEREVIFRKSDELGVPKDECEIILNGMMSQNLKKNSDKSGIKIDQNVKTKENYIDLNKIEQSIIKLENLSNGVNNILNSENENINKFILSKDLKTAIQSSNDIHDKNTLDKMINQPRVEKVSFKLFGKPQIQCFTLEWEYKDEIESILSSEEFYGYCVHKGFNAMVYYNERMLEREIESNQREFNNRITKGSHEYWRIHTFYIYTDKGVHFFHRNPYRDSDDYHSEETPYWATKNKMFFSWEFFMEKLPQKMQSLIEFRTVEGLRYSDEHREVLKRIPFTEREKLQNLYESEYFLGRFVYLYYEYTNPDIYSTINKLVLDLKLGFDDSQFTEFTTKADLKDKDLSSLMRLHNFIEKSIDKHNRAIDNFAQGFKLYNYSSITFPGFGSEGNFLSKVLDISNGAEIIKFISYHKEFLLFTTNLYRLRDILLNFLIKSDTVNSKKLFLLIEDLGVLSTRFEKDLLAAVDNIGSQLAELNKNLVGLNQRIIEFSETISHTLESIENKFDEQTNQLSNISGQLGYNNLISTINAYQTFKINKNTKS